MKIGSIFKIVLFLSFAIINSLQSFSNPPITYLGIEQGLSNNAVTSIYQDKNGFMWFGTYDGLNRYDGYQFKVFRNIIGDSTSLSSNSINAIEGDKYSNLWVASLNGVSIYNPIKSNFLPLKYKSFKGHTVLPIKGDVHILKAANEYMLVGSQQVGLIVFEKNGKTGLQIPLEINGSVRTNYNVSAIEFDSQVSVAWVFIQNEGLYKYDLNRRTLKLVNNTLKLANIIKSNRSGNGNFWLGAENNVYEYHDSTNQFSQDLLPEKTKVVNLCEDKSGIVWIGTDGEGLWLSKGAKLASRVLSPTGADLVNSNAVFSVYEDYHGRKWIGTLRGGVNMIDAQTSPFKTINHDGNGTNNRVENFILSFCEDEKSNVWIGTDGAGLRYWDRKNNSFSNYRHNASAGTISSNFITNIVKDYKNEIWISTWFGGVNKFNNTTHSFKQYPCYNTTTNTTETNAWLLYEDSKKRLWASTTNNGTLYLLNRSTDKFEVFDPEIQNIQSLSEDSEGTLWTGNYVSLIKLDLVNKRHITYNIGYPIRALHEDQSKNFWVGTQGGGLLLFNRNNGKITQYTTTSGLPSNTILRIIEDKKANLWMSTFNGIVRFNTKTKGNRNFSQSEGLQSNQFSFNAASALQSGEFIFGGIKGFNIFHPDSVYDRGSVQKAFITGLRIDNVPLEQDDSYITQYTSESVKEIKLPYDKAVLSVDYVAIEYSSPDKIKYAYYLEGWDKGWNYVNDLRTANYTRLHEGTYFFKIKVSNPYGVWNNETQLLKIIVLPPWYRTWWSFLFYAFILAGLIYYYLSYKARQTKLQYEVKLAHLNAEKEREINEKKLSFFTNVSHEFRTPLTLIINPIKDLLQKTENVEENKELNIVYRNARRLLSLVDQLLLFRKADTKGDTLKIAKHNFNNLCYDVYLSFVQLAKTKKINYTFEGTNSVIEIYADKEKIEIALFNLISNALKYTSAGGSVVFRLSENDNEVKVTVSDSGPGIPGEVGDKLFDKFYRIPAKNSSSKVGFGIGLYLVRKFVENHHGVITYESEPGKGTSFIMTLKKGVSHFEYELIQDEGAGEAQVEQSAILNEMAESPDSIEEKSDLKVLISDKRSILVVDDDAQLRKYIAQIFAERFVVYEASNGEDGIRIARQNTPDLIISDVSMPGMGGIEFCKTVKETVALAHIPVILLTGTSAKETKLKGVEYGADDYITKPFETELLVAR